MTRKELYQVYLLKKELTMWEKRLAELREKSLVGSQKIDGMPFANTNETHDAMFEHISRIMELQADIDTIRLNIEKNIADIEKYIVTLDDSLLRQIIEYRCCQCKSWEQTSAMIGYGTTSESIRKYFNRKYPKT